MDIRELKKLLKNSTSVLILDNGEPAFVILDYEVYKKGILERNDSPIPEKSELPIAEKSGTGDVRETEIMERLNKEIAALRQQIQAEEDKLRDPLSEDNE